MDLLLYDLNAGRTHRMYSSLSLDIGRNAIDEHGAIQVEDSLRLLNSMGILGDWFLEMKKHVQDGSIESIIKLMLRRRLYGAGMIDRSFIWSETDRGHGFWYERNRLFNKKIEEIVW